MRVRWRGLELPSKVSVDEKFTSDTFGRFIVEPFERGFGTTVGNSLRRVLLSSLQGAAITSVKIKGADHEFTTIPGVMEDVNEIILNVKDLVVKLEGDEPKTMTLAAGGPGEVTADLIEADTAITILNKDVQFMLNGVEQVRFTIGSDEWNERIARSKFAGMPMFGKPARGHIAIQDHGDRVWFRNIKIRPLP